MRSEKEIERTFKQANLSVEIDDKNDRAVLAEVVELQRRYTLRPGVPRQSLGLKLATVAITAAIALAVLVIHDRPSRSGPTRTAHQTIATCDLATAISLEKAFRQGGIEAVEHQYREAFGVSQPEAETPSIEDLLTTLETEMIDSRGENI